ncbi:Polyketide cyclase SnoaL-like domain [Macleaya cordata]|uniref:Polyketide cyclase SnoaL-like domain n=1 Tax=Macleaya cordata TaxID=56857 RepID=A0A200PV48_MACCD|nr:Polyketide cyclase SnoaL-like domain [Macleaya cordata]
MVNSILLPSSTRSPTFLLYTKNLTCSSSISDFSTTQKTLIKDESANRRKNFKTLIRLSSSQNPTTLAVTEEENEESLGSASDIVRNFYGGINRHDLASVEDLIAENCVYEDLVFPRPFVGRKAILEFFKKFTDSISKDLQFVIDDISDEDSLAIGVTWHLEWQGKPFPFSKGCSFYRLEVVNGKKQIIYGRDSVEPSIKPGETALVAIRGVTWLLQRFPQLADQL